MTQTPSALTEQAAKLRAEFDRAFAVPLRTSAAATQDLLAIRVDEQPYAIRLAQTAGLFVDRRITGVPARQASLLGIAGFRGVIVPVYCLATLLGHRRSQLPRWLTISAAAPIALAFDLFEGHLRVSADDILPQQAQLCGYVPDFVRSTEGVRPVLNLAAMVEALDAPALPEIVPPGKSEQR